MSNKKVNLRPDIYEAVKDMPDVLRMIQDIFVTIGDHGMSGDYSKDAETRRDQELAWGAYNEAVSDVGDAVASLLKSYGFPLVAAKRR